MAAYAKDSAILEIFAAEDGYVIRVWKWPTSPPPVPYRNLDLTEGVDFRQDRVVTSKIDLKTRLSDFVDNVFDV